MKRATSRHPSAAKVKKRVVLDDEVLELAAGGTAGHPVKTLSANHARFDPYKAFKFR